MTGHLADLHRDVVFGRAGGRIIWQPRIICWHSDRIFSGQGLPEPYAQMEYHDIFRSLGCSARLYEFNSCFRRVEHEAVTVHRKPLSDTDLETTIETPVGRQVVVTRRTVNSMEPITLKWEVETIEELRVAAWREENATWEWVQEQYDQWLAQVGDLGAPTVFLPRMNVQCLYIEKMGVENAVYAMFDRPDEVDAFFAALQRNQDRLLDLVCASPIEIINFGENVHSGTLSPDLFERYHLPECRRRSDRLHEAGKFVCSHWDGDTGPLLPYARQTGLDGIEAITPEPQGDVTLEQVKDALGDDLYLIDGIPAVYFDDTYPVEVLIEATEKIIDLFAPKLVLGISDEISSTGDIERIRVVGEIVDRYNESITENDS